MPNNDNHNKKHSSNPNDNQENQYQSSPMDQGDKIVDMKTFDQSEILKLIQHATEIGKTSSEKLSKPFLDSILSMKLSGSGMHKNIGNHINNEHKNVLKSFNNVFKSGSDYVNDTQNMQSTEIPSDFKKDPIKDLLDTNSLGVPLEDKDFHKRIPKIEIEESPDDESNTEKTSAETNPRHTAKLIQVSHSGKPIILPPASDEDKKELQRKLNDIKTYLEIIGKAGVITIKGTDIFVDDKLFDYEEVKNYIINSKADQQCIDALVKWEGVRLKIYNDHHPDEKVTKYDKKERPTIGYGHLINNKEEFEKYKNGITKEEAIQLLKKDLPEYEERVRLNITRPLHQHEFNALTIRAYNAPKYGFVIDNPYAKTNGSAKVVDALNNYEDLKSEEFEKNYQKLNTSGGKYMRGLEKRRIIELDILQNNDYITHNDDYYWDRLKYDKSTKK